MYFFSFFLVFIVYFVRRPHPHFTESLRLFCLILCLELKQTVTCDKEVYIVF